MTDKMPPDLLEVREVQGVSVVAFTRRTILDPLLIDQAGERMLSLIQNHPGCRLVLDFSRVESVTSAMFGKLVALHRTIEDGGGRLVFAGVNPFLLQIFQLCKLPPTIPIHASEADAVGALSAS